MPVRDGMRHNSNAHAATRTECEEPRGAFYHTLFDVHRGIALKDALGARCWRDVLQSAVSSVPLTSTPSSRFCGSRPACIRSSIAHPQQYPYTTTLGHGKANCYWYHLHVPAGFFARHGGDACRTSLLCPFLDTLSPTVDGHLAGTYADVLWDLT